MNKAIRIGVSLSILCVLFFGLLWYLSFFSNSINRYAKELAFVTDPNINEGREIKLKIVEDSLIPVSSIYFSIQKFDVLNNYITIKLDLRIPNEVFLMTLKSFDESFIAYENPQNNNEIILRDAFLNKNIRILIGNQYKNEEKLIPLKDFFQLDENNQVYKRRDSDIYSFNYTTKLYGNYIYYPSDEYEVISNIRLNYKELMLYADSFATYLPFNLYYVKSDLMREFSISFNDVIDSENYMQINMRIFRNIYFRIYYYFLAMFPTIVGFLVLIKLCFIKQKQSLDYILQITAIMIGILPLKSILVPDVFEKMVNLEALIGFNIICLISFLLFYYVFIDVVYDDNEELVKPPKNISSLN